jgi:hypothetical protein
MGSVKLCRLQRGGPRRLAAAPGARADAAGGGPWEWKTASEPLFQAKKLPQQARARFPCLSLP